MCIRKRLELSSSPTSLPSPPTPPMAPPHCRHSYPLTSDPPPEEPFQDRLKKLERENNRASLQVLEQEKTLMLCKKEHQRQLENLRAEQAEALLKVRA